VGGKSSCIPHEHQNNIAAGNPQLLDAFPDIDMEDHSLLDILDGVPDLVPATQFDDPPRPRTPTERFSTYPRVQFRVGKQDWDVPTPVFIAVA